MNTRIATLVAIFISGGILLSVGSPAMAKSAGLSKGSTGISREAKLVRLIRVKLAKQKLKRVVEKPVALVEKGRVTGNATRAERISDPLVAKAKRVADPVEARIGGKPARRAD